MLNLPTPVGVEHFAAIVKRDATYRKMISVSMNIAQVAYQGGPNLDEAMHKAEQLIYQLRSGGESSDFVHIREYLHPYLDPPDRDEFSPYAGRIRSGLSDLDKLLGGFNPSDLFIVAARTGVGKTALMLNFARNAAMDRAAGQGRGVLAGDGGRAAGAAPARPPSRASTPPACASACSARSRSRA